jgi:hypothetical protein
MIVVTKENLKIGAKVKRGPDWCWGNQDCSKEGKQEIGIIEGFGLGISDKNFWCGVSWPHEKNESFNFNYRLFVADLIYAEDIQLELDL